MILLIHLFRASLWYSMESLLDKHYFPVGCFSVGHLGFPDHVQVAFHYHISLNSSGSLTGGKSESINSSTSAKSQLLRLW